MAEQILYTLQIEGAEENLKLLKQLDEQIKANKKSIKDTGDVASEENEQRKIQLKQQQDQYRQLQKETKAIATAENALIDTLAKKRAELLRMNKELDNTKIGSERFKQLTAESKKLRDEIKGADEATGRFQGNVGNYKGAIMDAFKSMGINVQGLTQVVNVTNNTFNTLNQQINNVNKTTNTFNQQINNLTQNMTSGADATTKMSTAQKLLAAATSGGSKALKLFKIALASTGVGLIVIALGALVTYLTTTQAGIDSVNKVLKPLGAILDRIIGLVQRFGGGLAEILSGNFRKGFKELSDTVASVGDELAAGYEDGKRMASIIIDIDNAKLKLAENEGRIARAMAEQREILDDVNKSDAERKSAGEKFLQLNQELLQYKQDISKLELESAELNAAQNDTDRATLIELATKREELNALEAESLRKQREAKNKINSIDKKAADDARKNEQDRLDAISKEETAYLEMVSNRLDAEIKAIDKLIQKQIEANDPDAVLEQMDAEFDVELEKQVEQDDKRAMALIDFEDRKAAIAEQYRQAGLSQREKDYEAINALRDQDLINEEQYASAKATIDKAYFDSKLSAASDVFGNLAEIAGKETAVGKAAAIAQTTIATYSSATKAFNSLADIPVVGTVLGAIAAALAVASGLKNIAKIASVNPNPNKFARGGIIGGHSHADGGTVFRGSDGSVFEAERGELLAVVNKKDTEMLSALSTINSRNGINFAPSRRLAQGGYVIPQPRTDYPNDYRKIIDETVSQIGQIPVVVSETEITSTQSRVRRIKVSGDL